MTDFGGICRQKMFEEEKLDRDEITFVKRRRGIGGKRKCCDERLKKLLVFFCLDGN